MDPIAASGITNLNSANIVGFRAFIVLGIGGHLNVRR